MTYQMLDLRNSRSLPHQALWPAALAPIILIATKHRAMWLGFVFSAYSTLVLYAGLRYARYLMPAFPAIAILSAYSIYHFSSKAWSYVSARIQKRHVELRSLPITVLAAALALDIKDEYTINVPLIGHDPQARMDILRAKVPGFSVLEYLHQHPHGDIYQWGLEGTIYYAPNPIWGDHFGPWRYRDFTSFHPDALAQKLKAGGFSVLLTERRTARHLESAPDFETFFSEIATSPGAKAYRVIR